MVQTTSPTTRASCMVGCWLLVAGYWLLVAGCWQLVPGTQPERRLGVLVVPTTSDPLPATYLTSTWSTMPTMAASTGQSFRPDAMRAELPLTIRTVSPTPASTVSTATRKLPSGVPDGSTGRATSSLLLTSRSSFRVATTVPTMRARITGGRPYLVLEA